VPAYARELRPYRVTTYAVFLIFTLTFIGLVIRSVALDLYARSPSTGTDGTQMTFTACREQLEALNRRLETRLNAPLAPRAEKDWNAFKSDWDVFTRSFEDSLRQLHARCVEQAPTGAAPGSGPAMAEAAERLDALRQHMARCGEEGEAERESVNASLKRLRSLNEAVEP
jgi:hypothetical protein